MSFWKYTRDRESDDYSTTGEINQETGTPMSHEEVAQKVIDATDWNLVTAIVYARKEADKWEEEQKEVSKKEEE